MNAAKDSVGFPALLKTPKSPFIRSEDTTASIMADVLIALTPALVWSVYISGARVLTLVLVSVLSCMTLEAAAELLLRRKVTITDLSACVTGVLIVFLMPVTVPL